VFALLSGKRYPDLFQIKAFALPCIFLSG